MAVQGTHLINPELDSDAQISGKKSPLLQLYEF